MRLIPILSIVAACLLVSSTARPSPPDPGAPGPYAVGHTSFTIVDTSRDLTSPFGGRPVFVSVWYPIDASGVTEDTPEAVYPMDPFYSRWPLSHSADWEPFGILPAYEGVQPAASKPFPLVVMSSALGGRYWSSLGYVPRLASHGFVVAVAQHYHDGAYGWDTPDPLDTIMLNRPRDVSFMLDAIVARTDTREDSLFNAVRDDLVAASGHSLGGYAAMVLAAGDDVVCGSTDDPLADTCVPVRASIPDARIKAIVPIDGSSQLLHFAELARVTVPSMAIGRAWESAGDWQARQHAAISGHPNYRADIRNTLHTSFALGCTASRVQYALGIINLTQLNNTLATPQCTTALSQLEANRLAAKYAIAFLNTHLAGEAGYQHILTPGWALTREMDVEFFVTERRDANSIDEDWPDSFVYFPHQPGSRQLRAPKDPPSSPAMEREQP